MMTTVAALMGRHARLATIARRRRAAAGFLRLLGVGAAVVSSSCGGKGGTSPVTPTPANPAYRCGAIEAVGFLIEQHGVVQLTGSVGGGGAVSDSIHAGAFTHGMHLEFVGADSSVFAIADTCTENDLVIEVADTSIVRIENDPGLKWTFNLVGNAVGTTTLTLHPRNRGHEELTLPPIPVRVTVP